MELHNSVHALFVLGDFPLEHQTGALQLGVQLIGESAATQRTLERTEITSLSVMLMQSISDSWTQSDLSTIPAMCRLKLISSSDGRLCSICGEEEKEKEANVGDDREDFGAALRGSERLFDLAHVHFDRNHFEFVFILVIVQLIRSTHSPSEKQSKLFVQHSQLAMQVATTP